MTRSTTKAGLPGAGQRMPSTLRPMLAVLSELPSEPSDFGFEYKWDGVRALFMAPARGAVQLLSRNGNDIAHRYPELAPLTRTVGRKDTILDGEIIALDAKGRPDFGLLQHRMHLSDPAGIRAAVRNIPIAYMIFDLLWRGRSLMRLPYESRREQLERLGLAADAWQTPPSYPGQGRSMLQAARDAGLEGIVAKRLSSLYLPGARSPAWLKIKVTMRQEFVIGGWMPEKGNRMTRVGSLLVGYYDPAKPGKLQFAGGVGTGYDAKDHARLTALLKPLQRESSPFAGRVPRDGPMWVEPKLVAEVEFAEWTRQGIVRHPRFKGLRDDKKPQDVVREVA